MKKVFVREAKNEVAHASPASVISSWQSAARMHAYANRKQKRAFLLWDDAHYGYCYSISPKEKLPLLI